MTGRKSDRFSRTTLGAALEQFATLSNPDDRKWDAATAGSRFWTKAFQGGILKNMKSAATTVPVFALDETTDWEDIENAMAGSVEYQSSKLGKILPLMSSRR